MTYDDYEATPSQGRVERRGMINVSTVGGRRRRRYLVSAAVVAAGALFASSAAWACTLREGTLEVYNSDDAESDYSSCLDAGLECSRTEGTALIGAGARVDDNGSEITVKGDFLTADEFDVTFRKPNNLTANCHRTNADGSVSYLPGGQNIAGPDFTLVTTTPDSSNDLQPTGLARICVQEDQADMITVVVGQIVDVNVVTSV